MARRSLTPQLNQIRTWVRQGRTDAWIAHQLEVTVQQIEAFKREHELAADGDGRTAPPRRRDRPARRGRRADRRRARGRGRAPSAPRRRPRREAAEAEAAAAAGEDEPSDDDEDDAKPKRRRGRRGGRGRRRKAGSPLEGTFDHGEEGYGLWLDPAVQDDPVYAEHWAGHRPVEVTIEEDQIVIRRAAAT